MKIRRRLGFVALVVITVTIGFSRSASAQQPYEPTIGQPGKDVIWVPTSAELLDRMLDLARVTPEDFVVDLGSGDGRNIIAAAKRGARGLGVEYNPEMVELSRRLAREAGVADKASFVQGDMFEADISNATVLALFLLTSNLEKLEDTFLSLRPGTRIVLNTFPVPGWQPDAVETLDDCVNWCTALLYVVPARVDGMWRLDEAHRLVFGQEFQRISGIVTIGDGSIALSNPRLSGAEIRFSVLGTTYVGSVDGDRMSGVATDPAGATRPWSATRF